MESRTHEATPWHERILPLRDTITSKRYELCIIGGAGHVGLPLAVAFANQGVRTIILDINRDALATIRTGRFPFLEEQGDTELQRAWAGGRFAASDDPAVVAESDLVLLVIGTPIDNHLNPHFKLILETIESYLPYLCDGQVLILRSTVYPGTTEKVQQFLNDRGKNIQAAFCPERIVEGKAFLELRMVPQIIAAFNEDTSERLERLFRRLTTRHIIRVKPIEAELMKLFSNAWRYIKFAVANQFFMIANDHGVNYANIYQAMVEDYERMKDFPRPGFASGPCLFKDTMQLAAFSNNNFLLGHGAMLINEGLPNYFVRHLKVTHDLREKTVGILGMAFKANSDDPRDSLSYKLRDILETECREVLCHDAHIQDPTFCSLEEVLSRSDIIILGVPHADYRAIDPARYPQAEFLDIWHLWPGSELARSVAISR